MNDQERYPVGSRVRTCRTHMTGTVTEHRDGRLVVKIDGTSKELEYSPHGMMPED